MKLSKRAQAILAQAGVDPSPESVRKALEDRTISPRRTRGLGRALTAELYDWAGVSSSPDTHLDLRSWHFLQFKEILITPDAVRTAILDGVISKRTVDCGPVTLRNLRAYAGLPPEEPYRAPWWKFDPRTGRKL